MSFSNMQSLFGAGGSFPHFKASGGGGANERCQQSKKKISIYNKILNRPPKSKTLRLKRRFTQRSSFPFCPTTAHLYNDKKKKERRWKFLVYKTSAEVMIIITSPHLVRDGAIQCKVIWANHIMKS